MMATKTVRIATLYTRARRFAFTEPVEVVVTTDDDDGQLLSIACKEFDIVGTMDMAEFIAFFMATYDGLIGTRDRYLTLDAQDLRGTLARKVREVEAKYYAMPGERGWTPWPDEEGG